MRADGRDTYTSLFTARGYDLDFQSPKSSDLSLFKYGEKAYDHLLILPPRSKGGHLSNVP